MSPYQSLHLPAGFPPGLARDWQRTKSPAAFPEFERIRRGVSDRDAPFNKRNLVLYPLSYAEIQKQHPFMILASLTRVALAVVTNEAGLSYKPDDSSGEFVGLNRWGESLWLANPVT